MTYLMDNSITILAVLMALVLIYDNVYKYFVRFDKDIDSGMHLVDTYVNVNFLRYDAYRKKIYLKNRRPSIWE